VFCWCLILLFVCSSPQHTDNHFLLPGLFSFYLFNSSEMRRKRAMKLFSSRERKRRWNNHWPHLIDSLVVRRVWDFPLFYI
jgi:hypothetical protein